MRSYLLVLSFSQCWRIQHWLSWCGQNGYETSVSSSQQPTSGWIFGICCRASNPSWYLIVQYVARMWFLRTSSSSHFSAVLDFQPAVMVFCKIGSSWSRKRACYVPYKRRRFLSVSCDCFLYWISGISKVAISDRRVVNGVDIYGECRKLWCSSRLFQTFQQWRYERVVVMVKTVHILKKCPPPLSQCFCIAFFSLFR